MHAHGQKPYSGKCGLYSCFGRPERATARLICSFSYGETRKPTVMLRCRLWRSVILADMRFNHPFTVQPVCHVHLPGGEEVGVAVGDVNALVSHAIRSGLGLRFVHDLEQGKETVRLDKVNQALAMFGMEAVPGRIERKAEEEQP